jgi:transposase
VQQARVDYWERIKGIDPDKLVFLDETGFWVEMSRSMARSERGKKAYSLRRFYRGNKLTMIGAIKQGKVLTTKILEGSMKGDDFSEFIRLNLVPKLQAGDVVIMDNLNSHHREEIREMIEAVGARVEYLPISSPDFNPIEMMWSQIKSLVRKVRTTTVGVLYKVIEVAVNLIDASFLKNWFAKCCYCT